MALHIYTLVIISDVDNFYNILQLIRIMNTPFI